MKEIKITATDDQVSTIIAALEGCYEELHVTNIGGKPRKKKKGYDGVAEIEKSATASAVLIGFANSGSGSFNEKNAADWLSNQGLSPASASSTIHRLYKAGYIARGPVRGEWIAVTNKSFYYKGRAYGPPSTA